MMCKQNTKTNFFPILFAILLTAFSARAADPKICATMAPEKCLEMAKDFSKQAKLAGDMREKSRLAREGIAYAESCLEKSPDNVGCIYYRAVNLGLDLDARFVPSKSDLEKMVADFKRVIVLDGSYDNGGAYQALGYVYLLVPPIPLLGNDLQRDIDKAADYARQALNVAPKDPNNLKLAGEVYLKRKNFPEALKYLNDALKNSERISSPNSDDLKTRTEIKKLIKKAEKG